MSARSSRLRPGHVKVRTRLNLKVQGGTGWCPAKADPASVEIALETRGAVQRIGERDMAVGPHQVARVAGEPSERRAPVPGKDVQAQSSRRAARSQLARRRATDVHLPLERLERREGGRFG